MESYRQKVYWTLGLLLSLVILYLIQEALMVLFIAFIFASALFPVVEALDIKLPRWLAVLIPYIFLVGGILLLVLPLTGVTFQQLQRFIHDIPHYMDQLKEWASQWQFISQRYPLLSSFHPETLLNRLTAQNALLFTGFTGLTVVVSRLGLDLLTAILISMFILLDREKIQNYLLRFQPSQKHQPLRELIDHLIRSTGRFVTGQLLFMATFGALIGLGLYLIGGPFTSFAILLGCLSGVLTLIPILGPNIAMVLALAIAAFSPDGWLTALWVFLLFVGVQILENNLIGPLIMGKAVGLHPLVIIVSLMVGGMLFGLPGIVLAIPFVACLNIILEEWIVKERQEGLIQTPTIAPSAE